MALAPRSPWPSKISSPPPRFVFRSPGAAPDRDEGLLNPPNTDPHQVGAHQRRPHSQGWQDGYPGCCHREHQEEQDRPQGPSCRMSRQNPAVLSAHGAGAYLTMAVDPHRQGPRLPQPHPPPYIQPLCQPASLPLGCRVQDPLRQRRHGPDPREHRGRVLWH